MMLSVLIPTFNYDCSRLVRDLCGQGECLDGGFELIVADDASDDPGISAALQSLNALPRVRSVRVDSNYGRARIRNYLAELAHGDWLLFVDSDAMVPEVFSLSAYLDAAQGADVVCGGLRHPAVNPNPAASLRYKYERDADQRRSAAVRNQSPYMQLSTFSLMVRRDVFMAVRFDEACIDYGYEDTLFGAELEKRGMRVLHIDNPLIHMGLEDNPVFLNKTEKALQTLKRIEPLMGTHSELLRFVRKIRSCHLLWAVKIGYRLSRGFLRRNLLGKNPSLKLFAFYKLGYYLTL